MRNIKKNSRYWEAYKSLLWLVVLPKMSAKRARAIIAAMPRKAEKADKCNVLERAIETGHFVPFPLGTFFAAKYGD